MKSEELKEVLTELTEEKSVNNQMAEPVKKSKRQQYFEDQRRNLSDRELQLDLIYSQKLLIETMDKVRGNTNTLIWWLIAIPIILGIILGVIFA